MIRRLLPATALLALALVACGAPKAPLLTDPDEIISQGMEATGHATSFHVDVQLNGRLTPEQGQVTFNLDGTTAAGDFDVSHQLGRVTFDAPGLFGLSGEVIQIGADSYVKTKLTGEKYAKSTSDTTNPAADPDQIFSEVSGFLDKDGVETAKLDDLSCGDATCYHVTLSVPASLLADTAGSGVDLGQLAGDTVVLDLQFDQETLRLVQLSTDINGGTAGTASVLVIVSRYDEAVEVSPPPSEVVTEGGGLGL
jgi:hypothetical protein